jgi:hypothetical protein
VRLADGTFESDLGAISSDAAVRALAASEGPLTYTCAPPGSGKRMGVDRDFDLLGDGFKMISPKAADSSKVPSFTLLFLLIHSLKGGFPYPSFAVLFSFSATLRVPIITSCPSSTNFEANV